MSGDRGETIARSWNANAGAWTAAVRGGTIPSRTLGTDAAIVDAVVALRPRRVLDVGCGEGWLARALSERGIEVTGIDGSPALVESARASGGGTFHVCDFASLATAPELLGERYDAIVCNFALLAEDIAPILLTLSGYLTPTGSLVIQTVHPWIARGEGGYEDGWRTETFAGMGAGFVEPMPWYYRTLESWIGVLGGSGFRINGLREPRHPQTGDPLSLLIEVSASDRQRADRPDCGPGGAPS